MFCSTYLSENICDVIDHYLDEIVDENSTRGFGCAGFAHKIFTLDFHFMQRPSVLRPSFLKRVTTSMILKASGQILDLYILKPCEPRTSQCYNQQKIIPQDYGLKIPSYRLSQNFDWHITKCWIKFTLQSGNSILGTESESESHEKLLPCRTRTKTKWLG